jgi:hemerythrin
VNEIEGIFQTHCHDDHFAGLTSIVRSDRRLQYFAAPCVRASVEKKIGALMGIDPKRFAQLFDVHDLVPEEWNPVAGLEVRPVFSPHPVETTVMFFRAHGEKGPKTYAHLADLPSFDVLESMVTDDPAKDGVSPRLRDRFVQEVLAPMDVKKVDAGGGPIHGRPEDFVSDSSRKVILSHTAYSLSESQKEIGSNAAFGQSDVLIPIKHQTYLLRSASRYLATNFPEVPAHELGMLINCSIANFNAGSLIIKNGARNSDIFLILSGTVEVIDREGGLHNRLAAGAIAGELSVLYGEPSHRTVRAESAIAALRIPGAAYRDFITRNGLEESVQRIRENRRILFGSRLFGEMASFTAHREIARAMARHEVRHGQAAAHEGEPRIFLLAQGEIMLQSDGVPIELVLPGDFWGEATVIGDATSVCEAQALSDSVYFSIPAALLKEYPSVSLKMMEAFDRRMRVLRTRFRFEWQDFYAVGVPDLDSEHKELFDRINELSAPLARGSRGASPQLFRSMVDFVRLHFAREETLLESGGYAHMEEQRADHRRLLSELETLVAAEGTTAHRAKAPAPVFKNWLINHTLVENRAFREFLAGPAGRKIATSQGRPASH